MNIDSIDWNQWIPTEKAVLCYLINRDRVLLIRKKTGLGKGKINGPGGHIEEGETPREAAVREVREETGLRVSGLVECADLSFEFTDGLRMHGIAFLADQYTGTLTETDEADPFWCPIASIPYDQMWADDILWMPRALSGEYQTGKFIFDGDEMLSYRITTGRESHE